MPPGHPHFRPLGPAHYCPPRHPRYGEPWSRQEPEGSSAIEDALKRHGGFSGASKVDDVDQTDGDKIVGHVFGGKK